MTAAKDLFEDHDVIQEMGVVSAAGPELTVRTGRGSYRAEPALSCLVEPVEGDRVLVASSARGEAFVLAVLQRSADVAPRLRVEGDLSISSSGRIAFVAAEGVDIGTEGDVNVMGARLNVNTREGHFIVDSLAYIGKLARIDTGKIKSAVGLLDQVVGRFSLKAKRSYRFVDEVDVTRADQVDIRAHGTVNVRGKNATMNAEELVKIDAKQIHLG